MEVESDKAVTEATESKMSVDEIDKKKIKIVLINDVPHVWDAEEYLALRRDHRICVFLDGAAPGRLAPVVNCLPIRLSRVQAHYLVKHGIAEVFQLPSLSTTSPVSQEMVAELKSRRREEQMEAHRNKRRVTIESMVDKIIQGKMKKGRGIVPDRDTVIQEEMQKVVLPYEITQLDMKDPWIKKSDYVPCDIPNFFETSMEKLRYYVFEDFMKRNYFLTGGLKFGGDYLAYPGDPRLSHSEFIIFCHDSGKKGELPRNVRTMIRLANTVKKVLLIATLDEKKDTVKYRTMNAINRDTTNETNESDDDG